MFRHSVVSDSATPWTAAHQASLPFTTSQRMLRLMSIELMMPSCYLVLCLSLLFWPSIFPSIRVFFNKSTLYIRWPKYWNFSCSNSPCKKYSGLTSFRIDLYDVLALLGTLKSSLAPQFESIKSLVLSLLYGPILTPIHDYWKKP